MIHDIDVFTFHTKNAGSFILFDSERVYKFEKKIFQNKESMKIKESDQYNICDPMWANESLWGRYQKWHFKFNISFNI